MYGLVDDGSIPNLPLLSQSIATNENCRLNPYTDTTGHLTIGFGRNLTDNGISLDEARYMLGNDIRSALFQAEAEPCWANVKNNDARARAITEMVYNMGIGGFRTFVNATKLLCANDFNGAADAFLDSEWAKQVGNRAIILTQMIRTG